MHIKLTRQFGNNEEVILAEFVNAEDARLFLEKIRQEDGNKQTGAMLANYHLYDNKQLSAGTILHPFNVILQGPSEGLLARFSCLSDARYFVQVRIEANQASNPSEVYHILDGELWLEKHDKSSGSKPKKLTYRPSPLPTRFRPGPAGYWQEGEDDEEEK